MFQYPERELNSQNSPASRQSTQKAGGNNACLVLSQDIKKRYLFFNRLLFFIGLKPAKVTKGRGSKSDKGRKKTMTRFVFLYGC